MNLRVFTGPELAERLPALAEYVYATGLRSPSRHPAWLEVLADGLRHKPYCLEAVSDGRTAGVLPLAFVQSKLFGRYLVGLPYLNCGGVVAEDDDARAALVDRAVELAERLDVKHLELRHESPVEHPALGHRLTTKVHVRLDLPEGSDVLWDGFKPKVRNQVRKGEKAGLTVHWGREELLGEFYGVFSHNMRDLGTPVFSRRLFESILARFPEWAELCVVRLGGRPVAAALVVHGPGMTEVPSASSLRRYNATCANMLMYWHLLKRSVQRGQATFDFGRSTVDSNTFRFKRQWGAEPSQAVWQYHVRRGSMGDLRPDNPRYKLMIGVWQRLPVAVTRIVGPPIVRGIP